MKVIHKKIRVHSRIIHALVPEFENVKASKKCVRCGLSAEEFRDKLSAKEYELSGLCQACQDQIF